MTYEDDDIDAYVIEQFKLNGRQALDTPHSPREPTINAYEMNGFAIFIVYQDGEEHPARMSASDFESLKAATSLSTVGVGSRLDSRIQDAAFRWFDENEHKLEWICL